MTNDGLPPDVGQELYRIYQLERELNNRKQALSAKFRPFLKSALAKAKGELYVKFYLNDYSESHVGYLSEFVGEHTARLTVVSLSKSRCRYKVGQSYNLPLENIKCLLSKKEAKAAIAEVESALHEKLEESERRNNR